MADYGWAAVAAGIGSAVTGIVTPIAQFVHEGKQAKAGRAHELDLAAEQRKTMRTQMRLDASTAERVRAEAALATAQAQPVVATASWVGGSVLLLGLAYGMYRYRLGQARRE
jgi:hypothetical protein